MQCNYLDFKKEIKRKKKNGKTKSLFSNKYRYKEPDQPRVWKRTATNKRLIREQIKDLADRGMTDTS